MTKETYGVYKTPHLAKYQFLDADEDKVAGIMHDTWNFGNYLKAKGVSVAYMHGPIGLYEGVELHAEELIFKTKDHIKEFFDEISDAKDRVFFLYQKLPDMLRLDSLLKEEILQNRKPVKLKPKKSVDKLLESDNIAMKGETTNDYEEN